MLVLAPLPSSMLPNDKKEIRSSVCQSVYSFHLANWGNRGVVLRYLAGFYPALKQPKQKREKSVSLLVILCI